MYARLVRGAINILVLAVVMFLAIVYLKLGYFMVALLPAGAFIAVFVTRRERSGYPQVRSSLAAIAVYCGATALVWSAAIQHREEQKVLGWQVLERPAERAPEVRLLLGGSHYLFSHSAELAVFLESRSSETITVSLPVTRILGCFQSVGPARIQGWGVEPPAGYGAGAGPGPWEEHWWCP